MKKISWSQNNFDLEFDQGVRTVEMEVGNRGLGVIVSVLCTLAVLLPSSFTVKSMIDGTATGNPLGAIITVFLFLGWPIYWGISQFFKRCTITCNTDSFTMLFHTLLSEKEYEVPFFEYRRIIVSRTRGRSNLEFSGAIGMTPAYYVLAVHPKRKFSVKLYSSIPGQMEMSRLEKYSRLTKLPLDIIKERK